MSNDEKRDKKPLKFNMENGGPINNRFGLSPSRGGRLPSFKGHRDLTLGANAAKPNVDAKKNKFVPNLVQRRERKDDGKSGDVKQQPKEKKNRDFKDKGGAGRGAKPKNQYIQISGSVFAEGLHSDGSRRPGKFGGSSSGGGGAGGGDAKTMERPKLVIKQEYDKEAEEQRLKELLRGDFIDDLTTGDLVPVQLPMIDTGKVFKVEDVKEEEIKPTKTKKKRNNEFLDSDDDSEPEEVATKQPAAVIPPPLKAEEPKELTFPALVNQLVKAQKGEKKYDILFIQLPDHLPGTSEKGEPEKCTKDGVEAMSTLSSLPEGQLGKIQIHRSGKTKLVIGENRLDVDLGTQVGFLQDLVSVQLDTSDEDTTASGQMTVLGHVGHRVVVTPDWEQLLKDS